MTSAIGVDFDGVIHGYRDGWRDGTIYDEPVPGAFDAVRWLMDSYAVFVHTSRGPTAVADWITDRSGIATLVAATDDREFWDETGVLLVTRRKMPAVAYIDDRAIHFTSWKQTLAEVRRREEAHTR